MREENVILNWSYLLIKAVVLVVRAVAAAVVVFVGIVSFVLQVLQSAA
jgi:hypothetical protein